jgi:hypothetical protein
MARIRSIKPEFASDDKILKISDSTALFFVILWTVCDDAGYFPLDTHSLSVLTGRWKPQAIATFLRVLAASGLVKTSGANWRGAEATLTGPSRGAGVGLVVGWRHQRVDKPRPSKWKYQEISWDNAPSPAKNPMGIIGSRIIGREQGVDGIERLSDPPLAEGARMVPELASVAPETLVLESPPPPPTDKIAKPKKPEPPTRKTWESYSEAYLKRHGVMPVRNATVNGQLASFVDRVGAQAAPHVAEFYVNHSDAKYVRALHSVGLMLYDAESLHTQWKTGAPMLSSQAREVERREHNRSAFEQAFDNLEAMGVQFAGT